MSYKIMPDARYARTDEWVKIDGTDALVGLSDYAQDSLSDIVYVELPSVGEVFEAGTPFGVVESVKAASDLIAPVTGEVVAVNEQVIDQPELLNSDPYGSWLVRLRSSDPWQLNELMDADAYTTYLEGRDH